MYSYNTIHCMVLSTRLMSRWALHTPYDVWYRRRMNEVQQRLSALREKGWTLAAIADEIGQAKVTVESWSAAKRYPANAQAVFQALERLHQRKRVPPQRRYRKGQRHAAP